VRVTSVSTRVVSHLFTGSLAGIGKLPALAGWNIQYGMYGIFCTLRLGGSSILCNLRELPSKGGLGPSKRGQKREKKGFPPNVQYRRSLPSFPSVSVRKIPRKYQPILYQDTKSRYNSSIYLILRTIVLVRKHPFTQNFFHFFPPSWC
jgi:hypothetical protein